MTKDEEITSVYYQNSIDNLFGNKFGFMVRKKTFNFFMTVMKPDATTRILDVGVSSENTKLLSNFFEYFYPYPGNITCVGTEDGSHLEVKYNGLHFYQVNPHERLPFKDLEFDIAFSNAVIEHVGNRYQQEFFIKEICRVAKNVFIVTPNRGFPIETHTGLPLIHYLPKKIFRRILKTIGLEYWSSEENLNLLNFREFKELFPHDIMIEFKKIKLFGFTSNLIIYLKK
jgi:SAM-dependent methyltransferase